jgi:hypothetical protein
MFQIPFKLGHKQIVLFFENLQEEQVELSSRFIDKMKKFTLDQKQTVLKNYLTY